MRILLGVLLFLTAADAQTVVQGRVSDAATGEGLAAATVQVLGTSRGTITNREGDYQIEVPAGASDTLVVRYIGYETAMGVVSGPRLDLALTPSIAGLDEAVVTAGITADEIMRRVIQRKSEWRAGLQSWRADAYSRQTIRARGEVVAIIEGQTVAYWDRQRGLREVVTGSNQTGNLGVLSADVFTAADQVLNFYDDEIEFGGYDLMGPTNPRALSFYSFEIEGTRSDNGQRVYDLSIRPSNPLQPGFVGTLSVLLDQGALVAVSVRPNASVQFPLVSQFELTLAQQFSPFGLSVEGQAVWLPADFRLEGSGKAGNALIRFPDLGFAITSRFTDYAVNVAVPDSLFDTEETVVDSVALALGLTPAGIVPLSVDEERALADIDSTQSLAQALQPTGLLARFLTFNTSADSAPSAAASDLGAFRFSYGPTLAYNRAEGARVGGEVDAGAGRISFAGDLAYQTAAERLAAHAVVVARVAEGTQVGIGARRETTPIGGSEYVGPVLNSVPALVNGDDYFDYVQREGVGAWVRWQREGPLNPSVRLGVSLDDYDPAPVATRYTLFDRPLPSDNAIADRRDIAAATATVQLGDLGGPLTGGITSRRGARLRLEAGRLLAAPDRASVSSLDETYSRAEGDVWWTLPTFLRRRLLVPTLHVRLAAGVGTEAMPIQRAFGIDGQHVILAPFGSLRSRTGRLTLAQRYGLIAWEHDFRSVPFEILGWRGAAPRGVSFLVHGAHAWADGAPGALHTEASVVHHELGASVGLGYGAPVRLDATYRLTDDPGVVFGISLARLF